MKLFLDTANIQQIQQYLQTGLIDGITTNPSNLSKEGSSPKKVLSEICRLLVNRDVSIEVTEQDPNAVYKQAHEIAGIADNVVVKIPCIGIYYPVIQKLIHDKIPLNITLVFTLAQGLFMAKLGAKYISPFVGRWDDIDVDGTELLFELRAMIDQYDYATEILAASMRTIRHFHAAINAGADVATLPPELFEKAMNHTLSAQGIEKFNADWQKLGIKQFP